ncbi:DNA polymerase [Solibacillus silvestris]
MTNYENILRDSVVDIENLLEEREEKAKKKAVRAKSEVKPAAVKKVTKKEKQIEELAAMTILPDHYSTVWTEEDFEELCEWLKYHNTIAVDTETMGVNSFKDDIVGISFYAPHKGYYLPLKHDDPDVTCLSKEYVKGPLKRLLEAKNKKFLFHNYKFDAHVLHNWMDIDIKCYFDTMIAAGLLDENTSKALKDLAPLYLKVPADKFSTLFGKITFDRIPIKLNEDRTGNLSSYYAIKDTELTYNLAMYFAEILNRHHLKKVKALFYEVEMPFLHIVVKAERRGVQLDVDYLEGVVAKQLNEEVEELRMRIHKYVGDINLNSPAQLSDALYNKLKLPRVNEKKPDSTDAKTLRKLKNEHEVVKYLIEYRGKVKLKTAFADKLPKNVVNGRVHTSFGTLGTKTGRMSCKEPNLQQIPARIGGLIRNAFISDEGRLLASIDFSGQELRLLTHITQDATLLDIYANDGDVHSMTAVGMYNRTVKTEIKQLMARVYDIENGKNSHLLADTLIELKGKISQLDKGDVSYKYFEYCRAMSGHFQDEDGKLVQERFQDSQLITKLYEENAITTADAVQLLEEAQLGIKFEKIRKSAKTVNFGIIYGMSSMGLADTLEISVQEADEYILGYFDAYPGVKKWMNDMRKYIDRTEYTETMLGRKRRVYTEMRSEKYWLIDRAYRMGINAIIQGSAADMTKLASIKLQELLEELDVNIVLWVHDEIIFDVPENIGMENLRRIADVMCNALPLSCGLKSDIEVGRKWGQRMADNELDHLMEEDIA